MDKRIVYENEEGGVSIVVPSPKFNGSIEDIAKKSVPAGIEYTIVDAKDIPTDREYRHAWNKDLGICMDKARNIYMDKVRYERNERLKELDIKTMRGIDVQEEKQALRDIPQKLDLSKIKTIDELNNINPFEEK